MTDITLSDTQAAAVKSIIDWYKNRRDKQQVFRLFGYAGTGKSTILKYAIDEIGGRFMRRISKTDGEEVVAFDDETEDKDGSASPKILAAAFTGKAALVMTRKGTPASTIHSLCYSVQEPTKEAVEKARQELAELRQKGAGSMDVMLWNALVREREKAIKDMHRPHFVINLQSPIVDCDLIVLDEVSMVGEDMAMDLMSFKKPILVLGDPGQLPPIRGEGTFTQAKPDVMLTEIHRQAADSAFIRLATMARCGQRIPLGRYDDDVWKMKRNQVPVDLLLRSGQVLCGYNNTRFYLNNALRQYAGFESHLPGKGGEKIICLKNRGSEGLINGQFLSLSDVSDVEDYSFYAKIKTEDGIDVGEQQIYRGHFDDHIHFDKDRGQQDYFRKKSMVECTWGYTITVHKSQGSQWQNVVVWDDGFGRGEDRNRWLYTGITRAETGLLILE